LDTLDLRKKMADLIQVNVITKDRFGNILRLLKRDHFGLREHIILSDAPPTVGAGDVAEVAFKIEVDGLIDAIAAAIRAGDIEGYNITHS
ncbi:hypothetical protein BCN13_28455, partial [Salmonella enterica]|nr:hypothetical protein [Salmonella enterica]EAO7619241.1 hypothetical protein [Salmonella enterica]EAQ6819872.1 hypothetical protein [Salmonella enterica]